MDSKKIIATIGPSSLKKEVVERMDALGVDIFRINLSHIDIDQFEIIIKKVKEWTKKPICPDTEGAQLRTGSIYGNNMYLEAGSITSLVGSNVIGNRELIPLNVINPGELLSVGNVLRIDFNSVIVQLTEIKGSHVLARVIKGGEVGSNKGIGVDCPVELPCFTDKDLFAFEISKILNLNTFFLSFCSSGKDVTELRTLFDYPISIISKIESSKALNNLLPICKQSDAILIDRGDLSRDVPLIKIAFAQSYIMETAKSLGVPAYVATNLVESMVENSEPNRAEINDIVKTLEGGADGLVLAAESAIGSYPIECVRVISSLIKEVDKKPEQIKLEYLLNPPMDNLIAPHGGHLVQQLTPIEKNIEINDLPALTVNEKIESDIIQITNGTYSPLDRFMNYDELQSVLDNNQMRDGTVWTLPILLQLNNRQKNNYLNNEEIAIKSERTGRVFSILKVEKMEELKDIKNIVKKWFGTDDLEHPGVNQFMNSGTLILSGKPFLLEKYKPIQPRNYKLTPIQTRDLFSLYGWSDIIGYHTRNIPHRAHEYIQRKALEETNADGIFVSPVTGTKKKNDFTSAIIIKCFEKLIREKFYKPYGVLLGSFNTYSRYSGPKEAVFTAICRKNYGCNHFIVGRDHTGVGEYYTSDASQRIFDSVDIGIKILSYEKVGYCTRRKIITDQISNDKFDADMHEISGSSVRNYILQEKEIPDYLLNPVIAKEIKKMLNENKKSVFFH